MKPFLRFVGTILINQIAEIPGQPRFCVKRVLFLFSSKIDKKTDSCEIKRIAG